MGAPAAPNMTEESIQGDDMQQVLVKGLTYTVDIWAWATREMRTSPDMARIFLPHLDFSDSRSSPVDILENSVRPHSEPNAALSAREPTSESELFITTRGRLSHSHLEYPPPSPSICRGRRVGGFKLCTRQTVHELPEYCSLLV